MTLLQLKYVCMVEKYGSFSKAAQKLYVSQPGISSLIHALEDELGITIFIRSSLGVTITEDGHELIELAHKLLNDAQYIDDRFRGSKKKSDKISFFVSSQHYDFVVSAYRDLINEIPNEVYTLGLNQTSTANVVEDIKSRRSSLGILYLPGKNRKRMERMLDESRLQFRSLAVTKPHAFMSIHHPLAGRASVTPQDLAPYPCITYLQNDDSPSFFSEEILLPDFYPEKVIYISDLYLSWQFAIGCNAYDIGTGIIPDLCDRELTQVPIEIDATLDIGYIKLKGHPLSDIENRFLEILARKLP